MQTDDYKQKREKLQQKLKQLKFAVEIVKINLSQQDHSHHLTQRLKYQINKKEKTIAQQAAELADYKKVLAQKEAELEEATKSNAYLEERLKLYTIEAEAYEEINSTLFKEIESLSDEFSYTPKGEAVNRSKEKQTSKTESHDVMKLIEQLHLYGEQVEKSEQTIHELETHLEELTEEIAQLKQQLMG
ncbi:hypothetical protein FZC79_07880 [Rossellomorea vietnamensis]|uniref:Uncharacterized protein n=1 Tax=Rossellomorea vietnamensis TaxID=218284 RepID=A0A5D4KFJ2_9BACI|nr:hypothetical protein [Rossellomorea vietnamensis]TYR76064.1 hypothetical protein FZC79_07880 [Rossellomorea vietnamensis]